MDKLSTRITKMQSDNQMRFSDLENIDLKQNKDKKAKLPGTSKPQDFGAPQDTHQQIYHKNRKQIQLELLQQ